MRAPGQAPINDRIDVTKADSMACCVSVPFSGFGLRTVSVFASGRVQYGIARAASCWHGVWGSLLVHTYDDVRT